MKNSTLLFLFFLSLNSFSQNTEEKFRNKIWHANGDILRSEVLTMSTEPVANLTSDIEFLSEGNLEVTMKPIDVLVIYRYEFLNDKLKVYSTVTFKESNTKQEMALYYKIKELTTNKTFELSPIKETEYK